MAANGNGAAAAVAAALSGAGGGVAAASGDAAAAPEPYAAMAEALLRGLGSLDAAAAADVVVPAGGDDDVLGVGLDDGEEIDDAILEEEDDGIELHAEGEVEEPMDASAPPLVPVASAPGEATAPAVRPKEISSGRAQWHAQAAQRVDRGASEGERRAYWQSASWVQRRLAVNRLACVSFHGLPFFSTYPNLAAARI